MSKKETNGLRADEIRCPECGTVYSIDDLDILGLDLDPMDTNGEYDHGDACCPECECEFTVRAKVTLIVE